MTNYYLDKSPFKTRPQSKELSIWLKRMMVTQYKITKEYAEVSKKSQVDLDLIQNELSKYDEIEKLISQPHFKEDQIKNLPSDSTYEGQSAIQKKFTEYLKNYISQLPEDQLVNLQLKYLLILCIYIKQVFQSDNKYSNLIFDSYPEQKYDPINLNLYKFEMWLIAQSQEQMQILLKQLKNKFDELEAKKQ